MFSPSGSLERLIFRVQSAWTKRATEVIALGIAMGQKCTPGVAHLEAVRADTVVVRVSAVVVEIRVMAPAVPAAVAVVAVPEAVIQVVVPAVAVVAAVAVTPAITAVVAVMAPSAAVTETAEAVAAMPVVVAVVVHPTPLFPTRPPQTVQDG